MEQAFLEDGNFKGKDNYHYLKTDGLAKCPVIVE